MQTNIHPNLTGPNIDEAESILRSCVHCGFCTAVCPTYQELGDDLDSPRGRIYLIKTMLEEDALDASMNTHLDRCLTCRSCETTCPSGVEYGRLLDIGRDLAETRYQPTRSLTRTFSAGLLRRLLTRPKLFGALYRLGMLFRPLLPAVLKSKMPLPVAAFSPSDNTEFERQGILLQGCVQRSLTPGVNQAVTRLLNDRGIGIINVDDEGCCGAVDYHLGQHQDGLNRARQLIDKLMPMLDEADWILSSASGCGVTLKDYPAMFQNDSDYLDKAMRVARAVKDVSEVFQSLSFSCKPVSVAVHTPCTLQHGQGLPDTVSKLLEKAGARLVPSQENHLCCGSAGTYAVLEPALSKRLAERKSSALHAGEPDVIVTANVGCQTQLAGIDGTVPVMHWVEFLALYDTQE